MTSLSRTAGRLHGDVVLGGAAVAICVASIMDPDAVASGPVVCPFRLATGLPCPACGSIRSWTTAMHGRWSDAAALNPFALGLLALAGGLLGWRTLALVTDRVPTPDLERIARSRVTYGILATWLAWWLFRLVA